MIRHTRDAFIVELAPGSYWQNSAGRSRIGSVGDPSLASEAHAGSPVFKLEIFPREAFPYVRLVKVRISVEELEGPFVRYSNLFLDWALQRSALWGLSADDEQRFSRELRSCAAEIPEHQRAAFRASIESLRASNSRKVYLDARLSAPEEWTGAKTADGAIILLEHFTVTHLSLDHDLGDDRGTGYEVACWLEEAVLERDYPMPVVTVHSPDPVGRANIERVLDRIRERLEARNPPASEGVP
jgi:hypothetical protein